MQLVQVDPVSAQPPQRRLARPADVTGRGVLAGDQPLPGVEGIAELGGDHHFVAVPGQRPAQDLLAVPGAVHIGGVEEGDPELQPASQRSHRLLIIDIAPAIRHAIRDSRATDRPAPEPDLANLDAAAPQHPAHAVPFPYCRSNTTPEPGARSRPSGQADSSPYIPIASPEPGTNVGKPHSTALRNRRRDTRS